MTDSKLITILRSLRQDELERLCLFVNSPYFNKSEDLSRLLKYIYRFRPGFDSDELDRKRVVKKLKLKKRRLDERNLPYLMSELVRLIECFLSVERFKGDEQAFHQRLAENYLERGENDLCERAVNECIDLLEATSERSAVYYRHRWHLEYIKSRLYINRDIRRADKGIQQMTDYLDISYLANKLRYSFIQIDSTHFFNGKYEVRLLNKLLESIEKPPFSEVSALKIYKYAYCLALPSASEEDFLKLKDAVQRYGHELAEWELREIYSSMSNFCTRKANLGYSNFRKYNLEIAKEEIASDLLLSLGMLSSSRYKNIITIALRCGELEWAENFLEEYKRYLPEDRRDTAYHYNLAHVRFFQKDYDEVIRLLSIEIFKDPFEKNSSYMLMFKACCESSRIDDMSNLLRRYKYFLKSDMHLSPRLKELSQNWLNVALQITGMTYGQSEQKQQLYYYIQSNDIPDKEWLLKMLKCDLKAPKVKVT